MNRKEFSNLLREWKNNFVLSEKTIPQLHNMSSLGRSGQKAIVKQSRELNGWLTYFTTWTPNSPYNLNKFSEDSETYDKLYDLGKAQELEHNSISLKNEESVYSTEFLPLAKQLGFSVDTGDKSYGTDYSVIKLSPKKGNCDNIVKLFQNFVGKEADKIKESNCCSDNDPLFIVPFDYDFSHLIPGVRDHKASAHKNIIEGTERAIMHWAIHDMWHLIPEFLSDFSKLSGMTNDNSFEEIAADKKNIDIADAVSFVGSMELTRDQRDILNVKSDTSLPEISRELAKFFISKGITGQSELGYEDVGPSIFAYVLTDVESHDDIDFQMKNLSDEAKVAVKAVFDIAPDYWNKICQQFKDEIVLFVR